MEKNGSKILIVDDDKSSQKAVESLLLHQGYHLFFAGDGNSGLETASEIEPDLILLDLMMPGMDGFEVCREIRNNSVLAEVPILMISALDDRESRLQGLEVGVDDFIAKPFDRTEMRARVQSILRINRYRKLRDEHEQLEKAHKQLETSYDQTIEGWVKALDFRDQETEGHTRRVTEMTLRLAAKMGMTEEDLTHVRRGALLHDIGKMAVPDKILHKPGKLSEAEWDTMRRHPSFAADWLCQIEYLRPAVDIPLYHHEKWDGSGYPNGLHGEEIPLSARCFAVVDVWDALRSARPYKQAWTDDEALAYIKENSGKHFDPEVVEAFMKLLSETWIE